MTLKTTPFDPARYLKDDEDILAYLKSWMDDGSPQEIARALGDVARSKGMTEISRQTGLGRQALYTALSETGNPTLETVTAVLDSFGFELTVKKKAA